MPTLKELADELNDPDVRYALGNDEREGFLAALKDAARYRWLKANHLQTGPDSWIRTGDDLEEAIDEGMRGK